MVTGVQQMETVRQCVREGAYDYIVKPFDRDDLINTVERAVERARLIRQNEEYRASVLPPDVPRIAVEAAHPMSWYKWVGDDGVVIGLERFGASAPYERIYEELGLTVDRVVSTAKQVLSVRS